MFMLMMTQVVCGKERRVIRLQSHSRAGHWLAPISLVSPASHHLHPLPAQPSPAQPSPAFITKEQHSTLDGVSSEQR